MSSNESENERYEMLVNGDIHKVIPRLAVPTIISMMVSAIYNMADTFFVSQLGTSASGAVGIIFSAMAIIQALSFTIGMGSGNYMARCLGAGRHEDGERAVSVAFFTGFLLGTCLGVFCLFHIDQVVMLLGATEALCSGICPLYFPGHAFYDVFLYHEQPAAAPGPGCLCHGGNHRRRHP